MTTSRRGFLRGGLVALGAGLAGPRIEARSLFGAAVDRGTELVAETTPLLELDPRPASVIVGGFPFAPWFSGDSFENEAIPFHSKSDYFGGGAPRATERIDLAVVGGGLSGLSTAYLLRHRAPVVFELRDRFGGNAMGERWAGVPYSLGSAYVITPDEGSFLDAFYRELGLDRVRRDSFPPDPIELGGTIHDDFWSGRGLPGAERAALARYAEVVTYMAEEAYPEIPLPDDPREVERILALDRTTFREDLELRMGMPLTPLLAGAVQAYFYSSFGAGMEETSAASGWNFVAAEEFGRWVFPGGNAYMAWALWKRLAAAQTSGDKRAVPRLLANSRVVDVRPDGNRVLVSWIGPRGGVQTLSARQVVMAGSKHVCKHVLHELERWAPDLHEAMQRVEQAAYLVASVLLDVEVHPDRYDLFLVGDERFPANEGEAERHNAIVDVLRGDWVPAPGSRSVLTLYWPLPWPSARFTFLLNDPWQTYAEGAAAQLPRILELLDVPASAVRQVRLTRWGHAMPIARPRIIADGVPATFLAGLDGRIHFVNQDNWALPAVENSLLDAERAAGVVDAALARSARHRVLGL